MSPQGLTRLVVHRFSFRTQSEGVSAEVWLTVLFCLTLPFLGYAVATAKYQKFILLLLAGAAVALLGLVLLRRLELGLVALVPASLLVESELIAEIHHNLNLAVLLSAFLLSLWFTELLLGRRSLESAVSPVSLPLLLFLLVATLSFVLMQVLSGSYSWFAASPAPLRAQLGGLAVFFLSGGVFLIAVEYIRDLVWLKRITFSFLAVGTVVLALNCVPMFSGIRENWIPNGATGSLYWTWLVALAAGQAFFNRELNMKWRVLFLMVVILALYVGLFETMSWSSGWVPPLIALGVILLLGSFRLAIVLAILGVFLVLVQGDLLYGLVMEGDQEYSLLTRFEAMRVMVEIIKASPLLGLGPANYFHYTPLYSILGWYVNFSSHNNYIDIVAQTGLLGLGLLVWFLTRLGWLGWTLLDRVGSGFSYSYCLGAIGGLAGSLGAAFLGDWLLPFVYNVGLTGFRASFLAWLFLGGLVALARMRQASAYPQHHPLAPDPLLNTFEERPQS